MWSLDNSYSQNGSSHTGNPLLPRYDSIRHPQQPLSAHHHHPQSKFYLFLKKRMRYHILSSAPASPDFRYCRKTNRTPNSAGHMADFVLMRPA
ncbi:hypothetical protein B9Z19DRAFT_1071084 [Tuber borchii]|uniref:Uncharacterized protein n=1 Tax=Tuber borchii TaxID=42251 RepID=A0A2T7A8R2_TUBBO|nr:hypothetical protein B9Z19DRAFT_1071084 [Tuber borchii]